MANPVYAQSRERDQHRCQFPLDADHRGDSWRKCGSNKELASHHRQIRGQGGQDTLDNLISLCKHHHDWCHTHPEQAAQLGLIVMMVDGRYDTSRHHWMDDQIPEDGHFADEDQVFAGQDPPPLVW